MALHLLEQGIDVVAYNRSREKTEDLVQLRHSERRDAPSGASRSEESRRNPGIGRDPSPASPRVQDDEKAPGVLTPVYTIEDLVKQLKPPRIIWLMVEHGKAVDDVIAMLLQAGVETGDTIIDGGNSFYKDSIRRHQSLAEKRIHFLDVGTSGGIEGARNGACLMIGGEKEIVERLREFWDAASNGTSNVPVAFDCDAASPKLNTNSGTSNVPETTSNRAGGWTYFGPAGAGHFVKMVHNGVEYGMLEAIGEGFELLEKGPFTLDLHAVAQNWTKGSVVRSWLMELLERALSDRAGFEQIAGVVGGGSTGQWTQQTAKEEGVAIPVIDASVEARKTSQTKPTFSGKVVAALRNQFGGHVVETQRRPD